ncbi:MAG: hypothetical protein AB8B93_20080 [Pseudomonadales bacterium]
MKNLTLLVLASLLAAGCQTQVADHCIGSLGGNLTTAMSEAESRLSNGCEYQFDGYFQELLAIAEDNPDADNKKRFSDHLISAKSMGVISQRQAQERYNRYFNIKFVSLTGDYNTCSQTCPDRARVLSSMKQELTDKERGLLRISADQASYYRANTLLQEADLVLEATCRACEASTAAGQ